MTKNGLMTGALAIIVSGPGVPVGVPVGVVPMATAPSSAGYSCMVDQYRITGYTANDMVVVSTLHKDEHQPEGLAFVE